ncbi:MAG: helix-turn-helix transcriptional regulator [Nibricoccus sp.]
MSDCLASGVSDIRNAQPPSIAKRFSLVSAALRPFIDRIWSWESDSAAPLPLLLPGTGAELIFQYRAPLAVKENNRLRVLKDRALIFCLRSRACQLVATGPIGFISARLRGEALRHFAAAPITQWIDGFTPMEIGVGSAMASLLPQLETAPGFAARASLLEASLARILSNRPPARSLMDRAVAQLYYEAGTVKVAAVADQLNMSARHFERLFRDATGLSPKRFQRVARFHHTMRRLLLTQTTDYLPTALENGFYDQAHFIHECRAFTDKTPNTLLSEERFLSHFYNQSLAR